MKICILGLGSFGYALLRHIDRNNPDLDVAAWDVRGEVISELVQSGKLAIMSDKGQVSQRVQLTNQIHEALTGSDIVILCIASRGLSEVLDLIKPYLDSKPYLVNVAKALDSQGRRGSEKIANKLAPFYGKFGVLSGATRADDLLNQRFVTATIASEQTELLETMVSILKTPDFHLETTLHIESTEMAGVAKNLITLLYGYLKGYGYSETQAAFVVAETKFEMEELYPSLRTRALLPAWKVDVWMSAQTPTRNLRCGEYLGKKAANFEVAEEEIGTSEGWRTLKNLPSHEYLYEIAGFKAMYQLLISKEISQREFEKRLLI